MRVARRGRKLGWLETELAQGLVAHVRESLDAACKGAGRGAGNRYNTFDPDVTV